MQKPGLRYVMNREKEKLPLSITIQLCMKNYQKKYKASKITGKNPH